MMERPQARQHSTPKYDATKYYANETKPSDSDEIIHD